MADEIETRTHGATAMRLPRPRRQLIMGAGATASLILTVANRPAIAARACNHSTWISWKGPLKPSQEPSPPCIGDAPSTWLNNPESLWQPSWGLHFSQSSSFSAAFPAVLLNGWHLTGPDNFGAALAGNIIVNNSPPPKQTLPSSFPAQAVAAWLNINFYGDRYGTSSNAQTLAQLTSAVAACLPNNNYAAAVIAIGNFISKYQALNIA